jgi:hypothetical protein
MQGEKPIMNLKYAAKLLETKGLGFMNDMQLLFQGTEGMTLQSVGVKHGVTRERIRQIYKKLYREMYAIAADRRSKSRELVKLINRIKWLSMEERAKRNTGKAFNTELLFYRECKKRNFLIHQPTDRICDFFVNGYFVDVKITTKLTRQTKGDTAYYRFSTRKRQIARADFFAFYVAPLELFYIIPKKEIIKNQISYWVHIPECERHHCAAKNRYLKFENAWHLLERSSS